jgi:hypothetical protein
MLEAVKIHLSRFNKESFFQFKYTFHLISLHDNLNNVHGIFKLLSCCVQDTLQFHFWATKLRKVFKITRQFLSNTNWNDFKPASQVTLMLDLKEKVVCIYWCKLKICGNWDTSEIMTEIIMFYPNICHCEDEQSIILSFLSTFYSFIHIKNIC